MASMDRMKDQLRQFEVLRIEHELLRETSTEAYDRLQDYAARLERRIEGRVIDGELDGSVLRIAQDLSELQARLKDRLTHAQKVEASNQQLREDLRAMTGGDSVDHSLRLEIHVRGERIHELDGLLDRVAAHLDRLQEDLQAANRRADLTAAAVERANEAASRHHDVVRDTQRHARDLEDQLGQLRQARAQHAREYQVLSSDSRRSQKRLTQAHARVATLGPLQSENSALREELLRRVLPGDLHLGREPLVNI
ncbi:hypothetical protein PHYSODRAFT_301340 [Phytophthora sojae]|uniref:Uncharacterized protein n=1 Tax=Phytophthora sojae (strain P6497) TaxID=1094619 RepID=G4ZJJ2_PHYSP|nr:hypothetical protein PHYSODRAFT_301340 [Phytophthora sojae]EGZ18857.1 hypothetical protein PHYSODRAFT_301340 [Phytophthora sojae]|eukprot:XP_009527915.1 hypothetical protein PHYSODRAFT_301340 [Phytophthora sojae]